MQYSCKFDKGFCALRFCILCFAWSAVSRTFMEIHSEIGRFLPLPESMSGRLQVAVFFSLYRAGRFFFWTTRSLLDMRPAHLCNVVASSRKHQEFTSGPKGFAGPTGSLCLFRCMCGRVTSPRLAIMPSHRHEGPCVEHLATRTDFCVLLSPLTGGCSDDFHGSVAPQGWHSIGVYSALIEIIIGQHLGAISL